MNPPPGYVIVPQRLIDSIEDQCHRKNCTRLRVTGNTECRLHLTESRARERMPFGLRMNPVAYQVLKSQGFSDRQIRRMENGDH